MKKIIITTVMAGLISFNSFASDGGKNKDKTQVQYEVVNQFNADYHDAKNVVWTVNSTTQRADFILNGAKVTAFYDLSGQFLGLTEYVDYNTVDAQAKTEIAEAYKDYTVSEVIKLQTDDDVVYFVDLKSAASEILVKITPSSHVYFFKKVE